MKNELSVKFLVDEINRLRKEEILFQKKLDKEAPQWFYIEGRINSLTNILCYYYAKTKEADHENNQ